MSNICPYCSISNCTVWDVHKEMEAEREKKKEEKKREEKKKKKEAEEKSKQEKEEKGMREDAWIDGEGFHCRLH